MATKKKTTKKAVNFEDIYHKFTVDVDDCALQLFELKNSVMSGNITHTELIEDLWSISCKLNAAIEKSELAADPYYEDND